MSTSNIKTDASASETGDARKSPQESRLESRIDHEVEILPINSKQIDYAHPIWGTPLTTGTRAQRGYRLSKFCMTFMDPAVREAFKDDRESYMEKFGLTDFEKQLIRDQDWNGMLNYGVNIFMVLKVSFACGIGQNRTGAMLRGQSYEDFMASRNVREAT